MSDIISNSTGKGGEEEAHIDENDRIINSMQVMREKFISQLTVGGKFPSDKDDRDALLALMNSASNVALGGKKIKSAEKAAVSQSQVIHNLAEAVRIGRSTESAARRNDSLTKRVVPVVEINHVPGDRDIGCFPVSTTSIANGGDGFIEKE